MPFELHVMSFPFILPPAAKAGLNPLLPLF
jgi:hypothetical protein